MRTLVIHNNASGQGTDSLFKFVHHLVEDGDECVVRVLRRDADDMGAALLKDIEDFDLAVVSGGDGTVASVLYMLRKRNIPICIFPSGTANLFFSTLACPQDPDLLSQTCRAFATERIDMGEIEWGDGRVRHKRGFCLMAGIGFDADIMNAAIPAKRALGQAAYFIAAFANTHPPTHRFAIDVDGHKYERDGIACIVSNSSKIQGSIELVPNGSVTDGLLEVMVIEADHVAQLLGPLIFGLLDRSGTRLGRPHIEYFCGRDILVSTSTVEARLEIDGDPVEGMATGYHAKVLPGCNELIVGRGFSSTTHD